MNYINLSLENFKGINSTNLIVITFLVLILQTYKYQENKITGLDSYYVLLIYAAKTPGLFHWRTRKELQSPVHSIKSWVSLSLNQTSYG